MTELGIPFVEIVLELEAAPRIVYSWRDNPDERARRWDEARMFDYITSNSELRDLVAAALELVIEETA